jgi:chromosome segregation ATPase
LNTAVTQEQSKSLKLQNEITSLSTTIAALSNEKDFLMNENDKVTKEKVTLMDEILELKRGSNEMHKNNSAMLEEIEFMKQREIERIQQMDLDDIDLVSQELTFRQFKLEEKHKNVSKPNPLVPMLDFTKIFEWRDKQNIMDKQDEIRRQVQLNFDEDIELSIREDFDKFNLDQEAYKTQS